MGGYFRTVTATHVVYQGDVIDIDTFATTIISGGSGGITILDNNTTAIPLASDLVVDFATTANATSGVIELDTLPHIPDTATMVLCRVRAHINNTSSLPSRARLILSGTAATTHPSHTAIRIGATVTDSDLPTQGSLHWVDVQTAGGAAYPGINWFFEKAGTTPVGFFNVQVIGYRE